MGEFRDNLWAPWRLEYVRSLGDETAAGCFLCDYESRPEQDAAHHVVWRTSDSLVLLNRFPYTNGHLLIAPRLHKAELEEMTERETLSLWRHVRDAKALLSELIGAQGFNIGINFGRCAGAGLPGHLHVHVVPRWNGDTNFMAVMGDVRVIPQSLDALYLKMRDASRDRGLPRDGG